jgi:hypothetical protein
MNSSRDRWWLDIHTEGDWKVTTQEVHYISFRELLVHKKKKKIYEEINDFYSLSNTSTVQWGYQKLKIDNHKIVKTYFLDNLNWFRFSLHEICLADIT